MKTLLQLAVIVGFTAGGVVSADDKGKPEKANWDGTYTIVKGEKDGKPIPEEKLKGSIIKIEGNTIVGTDKDKKEFFGCTFRIDGSTTPNKIMMVSTAPKSGEKADGVIQASGDTVKLAYALPGGDTPTEFKTKDKQHYFELKRTSRQVR